MNQLLYEYMKDHPEFILPTPKKKEPQPDVFSHPRCPNCKTIGGISTERTIRHHNGRFRKHKCSKCQYKFETEMELPYSCPFCNSKNNFHVLETRNQLTGVARIYQCKECDYCISTFEEFPPPDVDMKADA